MFLDVFLVYICICRVLKNDDDALGNIDSI
jgi:hypothetical protein